jgi:hypothetical protein
MRKSYLNYKPKSINRSLSQVLNHIKALTMKDYTPDFDQLVQEIVAINQAWKVSEELSANLGNSLKDLKNRLQVRLLRSYAPQKVCLELDTTTESEEPLYGLRLLHPIDNRCYAEHLPVRVAEELLSSEELQQWTSTE